jgi:ribosomal protein S12 methylthiotransferase accessory factor YcaO
MYIVSVHWSTGHYASRRFAVDAAASDDAIQAVVRRLDDEDCMHGYSIECWLATSQTIEIS